MNRMSSPGSSRLARILRNPVRPIAALIALALAGFVVPRLAVSLPSSNITVPGARTPVPPSPDFLLQPTPTPSGGNAASRIIPTGRVVYGTITDEKGPIAGALLRFEVSDMSSREVILRKDVTTNATGDYILDLTELTAEQLAVQINARSPRHREEVKIDFIEAGQLPHMLSLGLAPGMVVCGRVESETGAPIAGADVIIPESPEGKTDADGNFCIESVPLVRAFELSVAADGYAPKYLQQRVTEVGKPAPVKVVLKPAREFRGAVIDTKGKPVAGATVTFSTSQVETSGESDAEGVFRLKGLPAEPGAVIVRIEHPDFALEQKTLKVAESVTSLTFQVKRPARLTGRVLDPAGRPVEGARLGLALPGMDFNELGRTQSNGTYSIDRLPPLLLTLTAMPPGVEGRTRSGELALRQNETGGVAGDVDPWSDESSSEFVGKREGTQITFERRDRRAQTAGEAAAQPNAIAATYRGQISSDGLRMRGRFTLTSAPRAATPPAAPPPSNAPASKALNRPGAAPSAAAQQAPAPAKGKKTAADAPPRGASAPKNPGAPLPSAAGNSPASPLRGGTWEAYRESGEPGNLEGYWQFSEVIELAGDEVVLGPARRMIGFAEGATETADVVLDPIANWRAKVLDAQGAPLSETRVRVIEWAGSPWGDRSVMTDEKGEVTLPLPATGPVKVLVGQPRMGGRVIDVESPAADAAKPDPVPVVLSPESNTVKPGLAGAGGESGRGVAPGVLAPDFAGETLDGKKLKLSELRGKIVLIDFWATWCGPCREETPNLMAVYKKFGANPKFVMLGISLDEDQQELLNVLKEEKIGWPQILNGTWGSGIAEKYKVEGIPYIVLIGADGKVIEGDLRGPGIQRAVESAMRKSGSADPAAPDAPTTP